MWVFLEILKDRVLVFLENLKDQKRIPVHFSIELIFIVEVLLLETQKLVDDNNQNRDKSAVIQTRVQNARNFQNIDVLHKRGIKCNAKGVHGCYRILPN
jgi:hypothetical protein